MIEKKLYHCQLFERANPYDSPQDYFIWGADTNEVYSILQDVINEDDNLRNASVVPRYFDCYVVYDENDAKPVTKYVKS